MNEYLNYLPFLIAGTLYGFIFGIIPIAGAATGLLTIYGFMEVFHHHPYGLVVFTTAVVVAASVGDLFSSIVMNIPGGNGSAATMVDGFPMSRKGQAARALSAAIFSTCSQGIIWGILVFAFLPYYAGIIMHFGIPEMLCFICLAMTCVVFINSDYWVRGLIGLAAGIFFGMIGTDPHSNAERFTFGWFYLAHGIQIIPMMAGFLAMPEILEAFTIEKGHAPPPKDIWEQIRQGARDSWKYKWDSIRGGLIGAGIGLLPGVGGAIVDWLAYGQTVATAKNDKIPFGEGNVRGVVGAEGANMAQKATAYIPTVLFGVPAAPFEVIVMSLFMYVGLEMGSPQVLTDGIFFGALSFGYLASLILTFTISLFFIRYATNITRVPFKYYFIPLIVLIAWSCGQYTGGWEDYAMFGICSVFGVLFKKFKLSRAATIIGFVLSPRIETVGMQYFAIYEPLDVLHRPISATLLVVMIIAVVYGIFFNRTKIKYV